MAATLGVLCDDAGDLGLDATQWRRGSAGMRSEIVPKRAENAAARLLRPRHSPHLNSGGDVLFRVVGQAIEACSARPAYDESIETSIAKFRYVRTGRVWRSFWFRARGK